MKIPKAVKLKSGEYQIRLRLGGQSISVRASSMAECKRRAATIKGEYNASLVSNNSNSCLSLRQIVQKYIDAMTPVLSPSTIRGYDQIVRNRFTAYIDKPMSMIDFQAMIGDESKKLSAKTVKNSWGLLRSAISYAGLPVPSVKLPAVPVKEIPFLQPEEVRPFCREISGDLAEIPILLELQGLRRSEAKGLDWKDVDLKHETICVHSSRVQNKDGDFVRKATTKNRSSTRIIPIMIPQLRTALERVESKSGPVVTVAENTMLKHTKAACIRAGITVVGNHGLRHTFVSVAYHQGLSILQIMELGGWADYQTIQKIYLRITQSARKAAPELVSVFFQEE